MLGAHSAGVASTGGDAAAGNPAGGGDAAGCMSAASLDGCTVTCASVGARSSVRRRFGGLPAPLPATRRAALLLALVAAAAAAFARRAASTCSDSLHTSRSDRLMLSMAVDCGNGVSLTATVSAASLGARAIRVLLRVAVRAGWFLVRHAACKQWGGGQGLLAASGGCAGCSGGAQLLGIGCGSDALGTGAEVSATGSVVCASGGTACQGAASVRVEGTRAMLGT